MLINIGPFNLSLGCKLRRLLSQVSTDLLLLLLLGWILCLLSSCTGLISCNFLIMGTGLLFLIGILHFVEFLFSDSLSLLNFLSESLL